MLRLGVTPREASFQAILDAQVAEQVRLFGRVCGNGVQFEQPLVDSIATRNKICGYSIGEYAPSRFLHFGQVFILTVASIRLSL